MEIDITQIAVGVIGIISAIVTGVVIPLIKSKVTNEQWVSIQNYALAGVQAAEIWWNHCGCNQNTSQHNPPAIKYLMIFHCDYSFPYFA